MAPPGDGPSWSRAPGIIVCSAGDETSLLTRERWDSVALDEVSQRVWQLLCVPRTVTDLVAVLSMEYEVSVERCRGDLESLLATLAEAGALRQSP